MTTKDIEKYFALLGCLSTHEGVEAMFKELGVKRRPILAKPPKSPYEAILRISSQGILLSFTEQNYWQKLPPLLHGKSDNLVFANIAITSGIPDVIRRYDGLMPFGLDWSDTREAARAKMEAAGYGDSLHAYKRDSYWLPDFNARLTYMPGDLAKPEIPGLFDISVGILSPPAPILERVSHYPTVDVIRSLFGASANEERFRGAFRDFESDDLVRAVEREAVDRKREYGFELYFDPRRPAPDGTPGFVGIDMVRDRLSDYQCWRGDLPFGLSFDDSPSVLIERVGVQPDHWDENITWGVARWYLPDFLLWINFDILDNRIESVSILATGYRDDLLGS